MEGTLKWNQNKPDSAAETKDKIECKIVTR
jgi:hypothetical protein